MGVSLIEQSQLPIKVEVAIGQHLLCDMTHCVILQINERAKLMGNNDPLAEILSRARDGSITKNDISTLNTRIVNTLEQAMKKAHPCAIYITSTHAKVADINVKFLEIMQAKGNRIHRLIAKHVPKGIGSFIMAADDLILKSRRLLYNVAGNLYYITYYYIFNTTM